MNSVDTQASPQAGPKKDYWKKASREFFAVAFLASAIFFFAVAFRFFSSNEEVKSALGTSIFLVLLAAGVLWFLLGRLFKNRSKLAIPAGLALNGLGLIVNLVQFNIIGALIFAYFLYVVFKAKKQKV